MIKKFKVGLTLQRMFISLFSAYFIFALFYFIYDYRQVTENAKNDSLKIAKISSLQVHSTFQQISNMLLIIDEKLRNNNLTRDDLSRYLSSINLLISDIETINISDKNGTIIASSNEIYIGRKHLKESVLHQTSNQRSNQFIYREDEKSLITSADLISFTYRKRDTNNVIQGAISALVPIQLLHDYFRTHLLESSHEVSVVSLRTCENLGSSTLEKDQFISKYISYDYCKKHNFNKLIEHENSIIDLETGNAIGYTISSVFKIATLSVIPKSSYMRPFYIKLIITIAISFIFVLSYWQLIKQQIATEKKLHDESALLNHASKMASLGEMASGIAHEINNPLGIAVGMLQQATKIIKRLDKPELSSLEKTIATTLFSLERITKIVQGMKVISRQGGTSSYQFVTLSQIFNNSTIFYQEKLKNKNTELSIAPIPDVCIMCNETQISQLVINLIGNSSDAIELLEERWIHISFELLEKEKKVKLLFTDSGKGISKEVLAKIMQPFFTTKAPGHGTGLGLTIINKIVQEHRGTFEYNEKSLNTQFVVTLNYEKPEVANTI